MLTRRPSLNSGAIETSRPASQAHRSQFLGSRPIEQYTTCNGGPRSANVEKISARASTESRRTNHASLAYVRSLSKGQRAAPTYNTALPARRSETDVAEKLHVIPYSELILRRKLDGGLSLIEANGGGDESVSWEEAWKLYMQNQAATVRELSARVQASSQQKLITTSTAVPSHPTLPSSRPDYPTHAATDQTITTVTTAKDGGEDPTKSSFLPNLWKKRLGRRRTRSLVLLNILAALYGSSTVAAKFATDVAPGLPPSLSSLIRFSSALVVFLPAAINVIQRDKNMALLKAGAELGGLLFAATVLETYGVGGPSSDAPLLFAFTVIFVPIMELCAGRQSVRNITRIASLVALSGMGVLEEEGFGWKGISIPHVGDFWGLAASAIYALHIFRSEAHSGKFQPFQLTAIQCGTVALLSLFWEVFRALNENTTAMEYITQFQSLPWGPLVYSGLVCAGLCSWLEIHGLRSVHASTATMVNTTIPIWGAFLSFYLRGEALDDSAIVGGVVILAASLFAQVVSKQEKTDAPKPKKMEPLSTGIKLESSQVAESVQSPQSGPKEIAGHDLDDQVISNPKPVASVPVADHVQGAIITSQLKFPYYAAQAKRLLVEAKLKLLSVKSLVMSATSSMLMSTPSVPSDSLHSTSSAITTSVSVQQAVNVLKNGATSFPVQVPINGAHATQWLDAAVAMLESAMVALGSDIVQAAEEAKDLAEVGEQLGQKAMGFMAMAVSSTESLSLNVDFLSNISDVADVASLEVVKALDVTTTLGLNSMNCALPMLMHHVDAISHIFLAGNSIP